MCPQGTRMAPIHCPKLHTLRVLVIKRLDTSVRGEGAGGPKSPDAYNPGAARKKPGIRRLQQT